MIVTSADGAGLLPARALIARGGWRSVRAPGWCPRRRSPAARAESIARHRAVVLLSTRGPRSRRARRDRRASSAAAAGCWSRPRRMSSRRCVAAMFGWKPAASFATTRQRADAGRHRPAASDLPPVRGARRQPRPGAVHARRGASRPEGWNVPARFNDGTPALLERAKARGASCCSPRTSIAAGTTFPLHPSFVPFVVEAVRYVSTRPSQPREFVVVAGAGRRARRARACTGGDGTDGRGERGSARIGDRRDDAGGVRADDRSRSAAGGAGDSGA